MRAAPLPHIAHVPASLAVRVLLLLLPLLAACVRGSGPGVLLPAGHETRTARATHPADPARSRHVILVSIDGLRPDAIARFRATTLQRLMREGSYTLEAQTILPSQTLPSHTSMLTGVPPEEHGITWNNDLTATKEALSVPTVFELARAAGVSTAAFFSKAKFHHLQRPGSLDYTQAPARSWAPWGATRTVEDAAGYLRREHPGLLFVHIGEPDYAGHAVGYMSWVYGENVRIADRAVGRLLAAAERAYGAGNFTLVVTSDHGGQGRGHGSDHPLDTTIPWIAYGQGVRAGTMLGPGVRTMDTAATALWMLGVPVPVSWSGRVVREAFH